MNYVQLNIWLNWTGTAAIFFAKAIQIDGAPLMGLNTMSLVILVCWNIILGFAKTVLLLVVVCNECSICCYRKNGAVGDEKGNQIFVEYYEFIEWKPHQAFQNLMSILSLKVDFLFF